MADSKVYRWTKFRNGIGSVDSVTLAVEQNLLEQNQIVENYSGQGFARQGDIVIGSLLKFNLYKPQMNKYFIVSFKAFESSIKLNIL